MHHACSFCMFFICFNLLTSTSSTTKTTVLIPRLLVMEAGSSGWRPPEDEEEEISTSSSSSTSYYAILGVNSQSSLQEIKRAYRRLAMQWHPDRWTRSPPLLSKAKRKFQQIQEAYSVLSDEKKRTLYDIGLYDDSQEEDEGFSEFLQEMLSLMAQERKKNKKYTLEELQTMLDEMAQGFESPLSYSGTCNSDELEGSKRQRFDSSSMKNSTGPHFGSLSWGMYGTNSSFCI